MLKPALTAAVLTLFAMPSQAHAQSAIETVMFILNGQEIVAPEQRWTGSLQHGNGGKTQYQIAALDDCKYEFVNLDRPESTRVTIDFSRVTEVNLKTQNAFDVSIHFMSHVSGLDGAVCYKSTSKDGWNGCFNNGSLANLPPNGRKGNVNTDKELQRLAIQMFQRKQSAYAYFRSKFCKPRAF